MKTYTISGKMILNNGYVNYYYFAYNVFQLVWGYLQAKRHCKDVSVKVYSKPKRRHRKCKNKYKLDIRR